jgi:autotransporter-associated beta strand protein
MGAFTSRRRVGVRALGVFVCLLVAPRVAAAATCTWNGGSNGNWSNPPNWDNCGGAHALPVSGDSLVFPSGVHQVATVNDIVGLTLTGVQIMGPSPGGLSYNITGNAVTFTAGPGLQFNAAPTQADAGALFALPITLGGPLVISNIGTGPVRVDSTINLNGQTLTFNPSTADLFSSNSINGGGPITKIGTQTLFLAGNNGFSGPLQIQSGTLRAENAGAFGSTISPGTSVAAGATLALDSLIITATTRPLTLAGGTLAGLSGSNFWPGPVTLTADSFIRAEAAASLGVGAISGNFALNKVGPGLVDLGLAGSAFTGLTTVQAGTLLVGNTPNTNVSVAAGTLGGGLGGGLHYGGAIGSLVASGGTVRSGRDSVHTGILDTRSVTLMGASTFGVALNGTVPGDAGYDQLNVTGTVGLANAGLNATLGFTPPPNSVFTIIKNNGSDPVTGTFANLPEGAALMIGGTPFTISYVGGTGHDVTLTTRTGATYFLSEGATGSFFDEDVLIANPNTATAPVSVTFLTSSGGTFVQSSTLPAQSHSTIHVNQIAGLESAAASTVVASTAALPLAVERTMFWDKTHYAGHTGSSVGQVSQDWVFAEGSQGFFNTFILLANPNTTAVDVTLTFLRELDVPIVKTVTVAASSRVTVDCGAFPEIVNRSFGFTVHGGQPIIAERAMYFGSTPTRLWSGGHESAGVPAPSRSWFLAEGATGSFFTTFVLLSNPQNVPANVTVQFLLDTGETITESRSIAGNGRLTINVGAEPDPRLKNAAVSTVVTSDVPIVVERSMYWIGDVVPWTEGSNSFGVVGSGTHWGLAEGRVGTGSHFHTYILLANPQTTAANVTVTYLRENGAAPIVKTYTVQPTSRFNIDVNSVSPDLHDESFGADVQVTNGVPIVVERSMYWDWNGVFWKGGTNATGLRLP